MEKRRDMDTERTQDWKAEVNACLQRGDNVAAAEAMREILKKETQWNRELVFVKRITDIYEEERRAGEEHTVLDSARNVDEAANHFVWVKLLLRRLEFGLPKEHWQELYRYCKEQQVSMTMLYSLLRINIICKEETCRRLVALYEKNEGKQSACVHYFEGLLREFGEVGRQDGK